MSVFLTIRIHAIPLSDTNGKRASTVTAKDFATAVETVNDIFETTGLRFAFDPEKDWHPKKSTSLNNLHNGGSEWWIEANKVAGMNRGELTVFLRWGKDAERSCQ